MTIVLGCAAPSEGGSPFSPQSEASGDADDDGSDTEDTGELDPDPSGATTDDEATGSSGRPDPDPDPSETTGESEETGDGDPLCYDEPLDPDADIADVVAAYGGSDWKDDLIEAMRRRWPAGAFLLDAQRDDSYFGQFSDSSSWTGMVSWLDTLVHEETHLFDAYHAIDVGEHAALYFREDLILYLPPEQGFPRREIMPLLAPEAQAGIYAPTYLSGSQGDRGFNALLDEAICYENEVPGLAVFGEYYEGGVSLRDGSAAFLYFIELYLRVARTDHPDFYAWAKEQPAYVEAVKVLWQRAHFFYEAVGDAWPNLGISDDMYRAHATADENLAEIEMFVGADLDASPCEQ